MFQQQNKRTQVADLISPINGYRGNLASKGAQIKNHMKDNLVELRKAESRNRLRKVENEVPAKELYKLPQFRDVEPKLYLNSSHDSPRQKHQFLVKNESMKRLDELTAENRIIRRQLKSQEPISARKAPTPKVTSKSTPVPKHDIDYIHMNKAASIIVPETRNVEEPPAKHKDYGRVPEYLEQRKHEQEVLEERRRQSKPDPNCPPGHTRISEEERLAVLQDLQASRSSALQQLSQMPFVLEGPTRIRQHQELEASLRQLDKSISAFSRPVVYVRS